MQVAKLGKQSGALNVKSANWNELILRYIRARGVRELPKKLLHSLQGA